MVSQILSLTLLLSLSFHSFEPISDSVFWLFSCCVALWGFLSDPGSILSMLYVLLALCSLLGFSGTLEENLAACSLIKHIVSMQTQLATKGTMAHSATPVL